METWHHAASYYCQSSICRTMHEFTLFSWLNSRHATIIAPPSCVSLDMKNATAFSLKFLPIIHLPNHPWIHSVQLTALASCNYDRSTILWYREDLICRKICFKLWTWKDKAWILTIGWKVSTSRRVWLPTTIEDTNRNPVACEGSCKMAYIDSAGTSGSEKFSF